VHVAIRDVELRVPGEKTHRFDTGAAADEGRAEVVAQRVEGPLADAELLLDARLLRPGPRPRRLAAWRANTSASDMGLPAPASRCERPVVLSLRPTAT
jgi:hypothetical protein